MKNHVEIYLPGEPRGKGRPRFARMKNGASIAYTDKKTLSYESELKFAAIKAMEGAAPIEGPVKVDMLIAFSIPKSMSKKQRELAWCGMIRPTKKPDADNVFKMVDALNGVVWRDDTQIVAAHIERIYSCAPFLKINVNSWRNDAKA